MILGITCMVFLGPGCVRFGFTPADQALTSANGSSEGGVPDGGVPDGGVPDGGVPDGGVPDGGVPDGGSDTTSDGNTSVDATFDVNSDGPVLAEHSWQETIGNTGADVGFGVALDLDRNVYLIGSFQDSLCFSGNCFTSKGQDDFFIVSFTSTGILRWWKILGGLGIDAVRGLAIDTDGNITLAGSFEGTVDLGGGSVTSTGQEDIFVTSFSSTGAHRWQQALGGASSDFGYSVAVDASGNVTLIGSFQGTAFLGDAQAISKGKDDIFVTSFSSTGVHRWQSALGGTGLDWASSVAVDTSGNVYLAGKFRETADLGGGSVTSRGQDDIFVTSFASNGDHRWQEALGSTSQDFGYGVAVDSSGNLSLVGLFEGALDLGDGVVTPKGSYDVFVINFVAATGVHRWQKALGGTDTDWGGGVGVNTNGDICLTGSFRGTSDFGGGPITSAGNYDIFASCFTSDGVHRWQTALGGLDYDMGSSVVVDTMGHIYLTGSFQGTADLGGGDVTSAGDHDIFLLKHVP
ncbi:MAG: hypothetical protein JRH20_22685 [Deltaproteobacteria bacterium]|nr:hypothetical protein [Deltaproteobacteria bacterium]